MYKKLYLAILLCVPSVYGKAEKLKEANHTTKKVALSACAGVIAITAIYFLTKEMYQRWSIWSSEQATKAVIAKGLSGY